MPRHDQFKPSVQEAEGLPSAAKRPVGRPSKYDPSFCAVVIEMGREGCSRHEMAAKIDIDMSTFRLWQKQHEEFSRAVTRAMDLCQAWWEANGRLATFKDIHVVFERPRTKHQGRLTVRKAFGAYRLPVRAGGGQASVLGLGRYRGAFGEPLQAARTICPANRIGV